MPLRKQREPDLGHRIAALQQAQASHKRGKRIIGGIPLVLPGLGMRQSKQQSKTNTLHKRGRRAQQQDIELEINNENQSEAEAWARFSEATFSSGKNEKENFGKSEDIADSNTPRQSLSTEATPLSPFNRNFDPVRRTLGPTNAAVAVRTPPDNLTSVNGKIDQFLSKAARINSEIDSIIDFANSSCDEINRDRSERKAANDASVGMKQNINETWDPWHDDQVLTTGTFDSDNGKEVIVRNDPPETMRERNVVNAKSPASFSSAFGIAHGNNELTDDPSELNLNAYYQPRSARGRLGIVERIDVFSPESVSNRNHDDLCQPVQRHRPSHAAGNRFNSTHTCITPRTTNSAKETDSISQDACSSLTRSSLGQRNNYLNQSSVTPVQKNGPDLKTFHRLPGISEGQISCPATGQTPAKQKGKSQVVEIRTTGDIEFELYDPKIHGPLRETQSTIALNQGQNRRDAAVRKDPDADKSNMQASQNRSGQKVMISEEKSPQHEQNESLLNSEADEIDKLLAILDPSSVENSERKKLNPSTSSHENNRKHITTMASNNLRGQQEERIHSHKKTSVEFDDFVQATCEVPLRNMDRQKKLCTTRAPRDPITELDKSRNSMSASIYDGTHQLPRKAVDQKSNSINNDDADCRLGMNSRRQDKSNYHADKLNALNYSSLSPFPTHSKTRMSELKTESPGHFSLPDEKQRSKSPLLTAEKRTIKTPSSDSKVFTHNGNGHSREQNVKYLEKRTYASESIRKYWQDYSNIRSRGSFDSLSEAVYSAVNSSVHLAALDRNEKTTDGQNSLEERKRREYSFGMNTDEQQATSARNEKKAGGQETFHEREAIKDFSAIYTNVKKAKGERNPTTTGRKEHIEQREDRRYNPWNDSKDVNINDLSGVGGSSNMYSNRLEKTITSQRGGIFQDVAYSDDTCGNHDLLSKSSAGLHTSIPVSQSQNKNQHHTWEDDLASFQLSLKESDALHDLKNRARSISEKYDLQNHSSQRLIDPPQMFGTSSALSHSKKERTSYDVSSETDRSSLLYNNDDAQAAITKFGWNHTAQRNNDPPPVGNPLPFDKKTHSRSSPQNSEIESTFSRKSFERKKTLSKNLEPPQIIKPNRSFRQQLSSSKASAKEQDRESSFTELSFEVAKTLEELRKRAQQLSTKHKPATSSTIGHDETNLSDSLFSLNEPVTLKELRNRVQAISSRYSTLTARAVEEYAEKLKKHKRPKKQSSDYKFETQSLLSSGSLDSDKSVSSRLEKEDYIPTGHIDEQVSYLTEETEIAKNNRNAMLQSRGRHEIPYPQSYSQQHEFNGQQHDYNGYSRRERNKGSFDSLHFMTRAGELEVNQLINDRPSTNLTQRYSRRNDGAGTKILPPFYERDAEDQSTYEDPSVHAPTPILSNVKTNSGDVNSEYSEEDEHSTTDKETDVNPGCSFVCGGVDVCALLGGRWCGSCANSS